MNKPTAASFAPARALRFWFPALLTAGALGAGLALPSGAAQQEPQPRRLTPVLPDAGQAVPFVPKEWRAALTDADLDAREASFERMVNLARTSEEALSWLRTVCGEGDRELAWTARLALREAEQKLADDPWALFGGGLRVDEFERRLKEFTTRFAPSWNAQVDPLVVPFAGLTRPNPAFPGTTKSFNIQNDADGWVIRVTESEGGEESVREYRGETLEEIVEANPELRSEPGITGMNLRRRLLPAHRRTRRPALRLRRSCSGSSGSTRVPPFGAGAARGAPRKPSGRCPSSPCAPTCWAWWCGRWPSPAGTPTGSTCAAPPRAPSRSSWASCPADVLLSVNGRALASEADLTAALAERPEHGRVEAVWRDVLGRRRSGTWRP